MKKQKGFAIIEVLLVLVLVAVIGFGGWYIWHSHHDTKVKYQQPSQAVLPVLGSLWGKYQTGYGSIKPTTVISGGDGASEVTDITWQSWGKPQAIGHGKALYVTANETAAQASLEPATAVAFNLGTCNGKAAYNAFEWYFPEYGQKYNPNKYTNACTGAGYPALTSSSNSNQ